MGKIRKTRSDIQIGNLEKKQGLMPGTIRNPDGSDARSDKELGTLLIEFGELHLGRQMPIPAPDYVKVIQVTLDAAIRQADNPKHRQVLESLRLQTQHAMDDLNPDDRPM